MLPALTGNVRRPGSGFLYLNGSDSRGVDSDWLAGAQLARADAPASISQMDLADVLADPGRSRALVCWNINPVASSPEQAALRAALTREDLLTVVCDLFLTDTAAYADYVLPAASFLESDDIVASYFHHTLSAQVKAVEPPGHALRNAEIFRRLAADMGYDEPGAAGGRRVADRAAARRLGRQPGRSSRGRARCASTPSLACSSPPASRRRAVASSSPRLLPRPTGIPACRSRASTSRRRPGTCGCSRRPRPGS